MGRGGQRPNAGRPKGSKNKTPAELREVAGKYTSEAVERLAWLMNNARNEATQLGACRELLDRSHGKATQHLGSDLDNPPAAPIIMFYPEDMDL